MVPVFACAGTVLRTGSFVVAEFESLGLEAHNRDPGIICISSLKRLDIHRVRKSFSATCQQSLTPALYLRSTCSASSRLYASAITLFSGTARHLFLQSLNLSEGFSAGNPGHLRSPCLNDWVLIGLSSPALRRRQGWRAPKAEIPRRSTLHSGPGGRATFPAALHTDPENRSDAEIKSAPGHLALRESHRGIPNAKCFMAVHLLLFIHTKRYIS